MLTPKKPAPCGVRAVWISSKGLPVRGHLRRAQIGIDTPVLGRLAPMILSHKQDKFLPSIQG